MKFTLQYVSDIHLEHLKEPLDIQAVSENLALCGDIGYLGSVSYSSFINTCAKTFKNVFVVFGNHEFYNEAFQCETMDEKKLHVTNAMFPSNVYFLDNTSVFIDVYTNTVYKTFPGSWNGSNVIQIIGTTLWSNVEDTAARLMNDYRYIYYTNDRKLTCEDVLDMFSKNIQYVLSQLDAYHVTSILLSHHGPHPICNGKFKGVKVESAYTSFIPELYERPNLLACISGHTHLSIDTQVHNIQFLSNQYGYPHEDKRSTKYNPHKVLEIPIFCAKKKV